MAWEIVLFDMDGTLSDSGQGITRCAHAALQAMGVAAPPPEALGYFVGPPLAESFGRFGFTGAEAERAIAQFRARYQEKGCREHAPYPGIPELLRALRRAGKRLALASSKPRVFAEQILEGYGVRDCFEEVMGSELDGRFGSKTLVLEELMRRFGADAAMKRTMVMVGDRVYDIEGAHNIGIPCVAVGYGYAEPGELAEADAYAETVPELSALLLES